MVNISEGRDRAVIDHVAGAAGVDLLDLHVDAHHHRSVLTLAGESAVRNVAEAAVARIDLDAHRGVHPRIGAVDVVPFVPLVGSTMADAITARDRFASWMADALAVPCFAYGPERSLPEVRRRSFVDLAPDRGPSAPHPTAGACAVGARPVLVAYNVWLAERDLNRARAIAGEIRRPGLRTLGLAVGDGVQVSMNLTNPASIGPAAAADLVGARAEIERCELVGLVPRAVVDATPPTRWAELDLSPEQTIEARVGGVTPYRP